jgi:20S proteasome alpha/beta subunit
MIRPLAEWRTCKSEVDPQPKDWGIIGMTVCIVSTCSRENCIVAITDKMLSTSIMSMDDVAVKIKALGRHWMAMFSGNDISPVVPIFKHVRAMLGPESCLETLEDITSAFVTAIRKEITAKVEANVLSGLGWSLEEFRQRGLKSLGSEVFNRLAYQIESMGLDLTFIVFGFEGSEDHIFTVNGSGSISYFDMGGFWAIGSGQTSALGTLFASRTPVIFKSCSEVLYQLAKAKFSAESAIGVGKETLATVLYENGVRYMITTREMAKLKSLWESTRELDVPPPASILAQELLNDAKTPTDFLSTDNSKVGESPQ